MESGSLAKQVTVMEAPKRWPLPDFRELWARRDLVYFIAKRDVVVRYKQATIGAFWALLQPLLLAVVFSVFFGLVAKVPSAKGIPYPIFVVSGFVMWIYVSSAASAASLSVIANGPLLSKVYFPRLAMPLAAVAPPVVDFLAGFAIVVAITLGYGFTPQPQILLLPLLLVLTMMTILGIGLWLSALSAKYRDVVLLIPTLTQVGLFISPIVYPIELVPANLQALYLLNPVAGLLEVYRWMLLPTAWPGTLLLIPLGTSIFLLVTGTMYFKRAEQGFADVV